MDSTWSKYGKLHRTDKPITNPPEDSPDSVCDHCVSHVTRQPRIETHKPESQAFSPVSRTPILGHPRDALKRVAEKTWVYCKIASRP